MFGVWSLVAATANSFLALFLALFLSGFSEASFTVSRSAYLKVREALEGGANL